jgi:hypothetical protein
MNPTKSSAQIATATQYNTRQKALSYYYNGRPATNIPICAETQRTNETQNKITGKATYKLAFTGRDETKSTPFVT